MADVSAKGSMMKMGIDEAHELYERISYNQSTWPIDRYMLKKLVGMHSTDAAIKLVAQTEAITKKLGNLSQSVNLVHQPALICIG